MSDKPQHLHVVCPRCQAQRGQLCRGYYGAAIVTSHRERKAKSRSQAAKNPYNKSPRP